MRIIWSYLFPGRSSCYVVWVCNNYRRKNHNCCSVMGLMIYLSCIFWRFLFLSRFFFFDDEPDNDGSGSGSYGTCAFTFCSGNSVGRGIGVGSGVFVLTGIESIGDFVLLVMFVPIGVESKVGWIIEIFSDSKYWIYLIVSKSLLKL